MHLFSRRAAAPGSILVVDDDPAARRMVARMLGVTGQPVIQVAGAAAALEQLLAAGPRIDLVVTDVFMPGVGGDELAEQIWAIDPRLPVLFVSGSAASETPERAGPVGPSAFLLKPFEGAALVRSVTGLQGQARQAHRDRGRAPAATAAVARLRAHLPTGHALGAAEWTRRHRLIVAILWTHVLLLALIGLAMMPDHPIHAISHGAILLPYALLANRRRAPKRIRGLAAALGLLTASAVIVHLSGGVIEAHFHYFLVVALLSLYEDWTLFLAAMLFVLLEHAVMSLVEPMMVFAHPGSPWLWSGIHAVAISLMGGINIVAWRFNEDIRRATSRAQRRLDHRLSHDHLTGLPNRRLLVEEAQRAAHGSAGPETDVAVIRIDMDNFRLINDFYGHTAGDRLLIDIATRLRAAVRASDLVTRSEGDEFVILSRSIASEEQARNAAAGVLAAFDEPFVIAGGARKVSASIGVSLTSHDDESIANALARADAALSHAKADGRGRAQLADAAVLEAAQRRTTIQDALEQCEARDFEVHYQPIVDLRDGSIAAVEALLRWTHAELGVVSPEEFIPLAESCGRILDLGRWVLERACVDAVAWDAVRGRPLKVFVNISASQITHPGFAETVAGAMATTGATAKNIALEITESAAVDRVAAATNIAALRAAGVEFVLDDFGVGYSSLGSLGGVGISTIKLDRSFVSGPPSPENRAILAAVTELARGLSIPAVAEGIETREQLGIVRAARFGLAQGYLFARPQPAAVLNALVCAERPFCHLLDGHAPTLAA